MKKIILLPAVLFTILVGCVKDANTNLGDLGGPYTLNGTMFFFDSLTKNYTYTNVSTVIVYLKYTSDPTGFLTSTPSNAAGQYTFKGIDPSKAYTVYAMTDRDSLHFYGYKDYPTGTIADRQSDSLILLPSPYNQNGIFCRLFDTSNSAFAGCHLFIFNNKEARDKKDTLNSNWVLTSDGFGRTLKINLAPGKYYVYAAGNQKNQVWEAMDDIVVTNAGIVRKRLYLTPAKNNALLIYIKQNDGSPVANCNVYVYNNKDLWNNPDDSTGVGSIPPTLHSGLDGKCPQLNMLPKGDYYIRAYAKFGALTVRGSGSVAVDGDTVAIKTVFVTVK